MALPGLQKIAGTDYPLVHQTMNTCGLASLAMIFLHHSKEIDTFLERVYLAKHAHVKGNKIEPGKHDAAILWAEGFLLLKSRASRRVANWLKRTAGDFVYEDFKLTIDVLLGNLAERHARRDRVLGTALKYFRHGTIRKPLVRQYLEQFKTQLELRVLAAMFGFEFVPYQGDTMGNLCFANGDRGMAPKIEFMRDMLDKSDHATLVGHGQSHWMVPHSLYKGNGMGQEYIIGINDPLGSSSRMMVKNLDHTYLFYFFKFNEQSCRSTIAFLEDRLYL